MSSKRKLIIIMTIIIIVTVITANTEYALWLGTILSPAYIVIVLIPQLMKLMG